MDYTCENCTQRFTWDCDDGRPTYRCENFILDETTLSKREREILRALRQLMRERGKDNA